jgi:2-hydroxy-6-oxonona-2,4-dienedioate hydrolase
MYTASTLDVRDRQVTVDGLKLHFLDAGEGYPVLLLHGGSLGSSADVFYENLGDLARHGYRAISFDQPGFGTSDNPQDYSLGYRRGLILQFMDALGLERAALVGHSQSGKIAFMLAEKHPDRISHVIVLGTGSLLPPLPDTGKLKDESPAEGHEGTETEPTLEDTRRMLEGNLYHTELITEEVLQRRHGHSTGKNFEAFIERGKPIWKKAKKGSSDDAPLWERIATSRVPVRMLYGRQDRANAAERVALLQSQHPEIDVCLLDECKHLIPWDTPVEFVRLTSEFLKQEGH